MARRYWRNRALLVKAETTYGTDSVPTGAANAVKGVDIDFAPSVGNELPLDYVVPYMGHQGVLLDSTHGTVSFKVDIAGSGAAGTPPAYGPMLRAGGMREVISTGVDVQYNPMSSLLESVSMRWLGDGVQHIFLGARGNTAWSMRPGEIPRFTFTFTGLLGTISDTAMPTLNLASFQDVLPVNKANTTFSLHGYAGGTEGMTFDLGNQVEADMLINEEAIELVDRRMTGSAIMRAASISTVNWYAISKAHTKGVLTAQHGTGPGKIVMFDAPAVQIGRPTIGQSKLIINNTLPLMFIPSAGNDEILITVK